MKKRLRGGRREDGEQGLPVLKGSCIFCLTHWSHVSLLCACVWEVAVEIGKQCTAS